MSIMLFLSVLSVEGKLICIFYLIFKDDLFDQIHMEYGTFLVGGYKSGAMILNIIFFYILNTTSQTEESYKNTKKMSPTKRMNRMGDFFFRGLASFFFCQILCHIFCRDNFSCGCERCRCGQ